MQTLGIVLVTLGVSVIALTGYVYVLIWAINELEEIEAFLEEPFQ